MQSRPMNCYMVLFLKFSVSFMQWSYKIDEMDSFLSKPAYTSPFLKAS